MSRQTERYAERQNPETAALLREYKERQAGNSSTIFTRKNIALGSAAVALVGGALFWAWSQSAGEPEAVSPSVNPSLPMCDAPENPIFEV